MSATVLISGRLCRDPENKMSGAGKAYVTVTVRVSNGDDVTWWKILAFGETAAEELLTLRNGDAVSVSGDFKAEVYDGRSGPKVGFTIFADRAISAKRQKRERRAEPKPAPAEAQASQPFDDEIPL
jgi:single-stranded DNA-binding protein